MYCLDHEIVPELGTPARNHLIFPDKDIKRKKISFKLLNKEKVAITSNKSNFNGKICPSRWKFFQRYGENML